MEWGSLNSVGLHIAEWIVEVYDLCVLLEWGIMYKINLQLLHIQEEKTS